MESTEEIEEALAIHYGFKRGISLSKIEAGFLSENYKVKTDSGDYFLKCYRFDKREKIEEIHRIKQYFASKGIPVILPIRRRTGATYFSLGDKYFALFPFVSGIHFNRGSMPVEAIRAIADLAARMHKAGAECDFTTVERFGDRTKDKFRGEAKELLAIIEAIDVKSAFDELALKSLQLKAALVERDSKPVMALAKEKQILLQGDFHEQNVFFDREGNVKWIFDFEKAVTGYRSFELWRSADYMFMNGDFSDKRIGDAILYLKEYSQKNPIAPEELWAGLEMYYQRLIHSLWVEKEHYLKGSTRTDHFLDTKTIEYFADNREAFKQRIAMGVYGK